MVRFVILQTWSENMSKTKAPTISDAREADFTAITFYPDLTKFGMQTLDKDIVDLFTRRAYDIAASSKGVKVILNGKRVPVSSKGTFSLKRKGVVST